MERRVFDRIGRRIFDHLEEEAVVI